MSDHDGGHDALCVATQQSHPFPFEVCVCAVVAEARADERARIARAIEAEHQQAGEFCCFNDQVHARLTLDARIARGGDDD